MKKLIQEFLNQFCIKVAENEDSATTELYMDDHDCIEFEDEQFYVPKDNSSYSEDDELTRDMLISTFSL